ncbi:MAG: PEF-CTERM sorting domain-containing protein [Methanosarcinales archaeon]
MKTEFIKTMAISSMLVLLFTNLGLADPGIVLTVTPRDSSVVRGNTLSLEVNVTSITDKDELIELSVPNQYQQTNWTYTFSENSFIIKPEETKLLDLNIEVPVTAPIDVYPHEVKAEAFLPPPLTFLGAIESSPFFINVDVLIPEFPTIAIPALISLGIIFFVFRKRRKD